MAKSPRIGLSITDDMDRKLDELAFELRKPKSEVIREALETFLKQHGKEVAGRLQWGGEREKKGGE